MSVGSPSYTQKYIRNRDGADNRDDDTNRSDISKKSDLVISRGSELEDQSEGLV
jgi:hypothetical protein